MDLELLFKLAHAIVLVGWIALALAPLRRPLLVRLARGVGIALAVGYSLLLWRSAGGTGPEIDYTLAGLSAFFADPQLRLLGWVHYLCFDLWIGTWEVEAGERAGMRHLLLLPCLLFTFLLGPIGLLLFVAVRAVHGRARSSEEPFGTRMA